MKKISVAILFLGVLAGSFLPAGATITTSCYVFPDSVLQDSLLNIVPLHDSLWKDKDVNLYYGVTFYKDGILFMDNTRNKLGVLSEYASFGDYNTFYAPLKKGLDPGEPDLFTKKSPFPYPPGGMAITANGREIYVTRSEKTRSGKVLYAIYKAQKDTNNYKWIIDPQPLPLCKGDFSCMQPALSSDGKILVFVSDMQGNNKGMDLFFSLKKENTWSAPRKLPSPVNSDADELFPVLDEYNNLYFSSDRDPASTGYDIFFSPFNGLGWSKAFKLNQTVNSSGNDMIWRIKPHDTLALLISFPDSGKPVATLFGVSLSDTLKSNYASRTRLFPEDTLSQISTTVATETVVPQEKPSTHELAESTVKKPVVIPPPPPQPQPKPEKKPSDIVFKVQIVASMIPSGSYAVWIDHKKYYTWEYFYQGAYRYTIGEFDNVEDALKLKALCRQQGYPQAFVAAFRHNKRVLDPAVFKH